MTEDATPQYASTSAPAHPTPPTNTLAIVSLIAAIFAPPVGLVLGIVAHRQIARSGESGSGLAVAGAIVGGVLTGLFTLFFIAWLGTFLSVLGNVFAAFLR